MKLSLYVLTAVLILTVTVTAASAAMNHHPAPDFTLTDLKGQDITLSALHNHVIILTFWATWCNSCHKQIPALKKLYEKYKDKDVIVLAVSLDSNKNDRVSKFVKEWKIDYTILLGSMEIAQRYGVRGIPTTWIIGKKGRLVRQFVGPQKFKTFKADIEKVL